jgi:hypothetical protein
MSNRKRYPHRKVAESVLAEHFSDLDVGVRNALATSLVRQWLTNDGCAGFVTTSHRYWIQLVPKEDGGVQVGVRKFKGSWGAVLSQDWHLEEDKIPAFLHQLNLCQSAQCRNKDGRSISIRIEPKARTIRCQELPGEEDATGQ